MKVIQCHCIKCKSIFLAHYKKSIVCPKCNIPGYVIKVKL